MVTLLVDDIRKTEAGTVAITTTLFKFMHNLERFGDVYKQTFLEGANDSPQGYLDMALMGRFIFIAQLGKNETNAQMIFYDTENDKEKALTIAVNLMFSGKGLQEGFKTAFMQCFEGLQPYYDERYSDAELVLDLSHNN